MRDWASGGGAKIERAKEHVADFERESRKFLDANRYSATSEFDAEKGWIRFYVTDCPTIPPRLAAITADAIHNFRVTLEILWRQVWGGKRRQAFPWLEDSHELETRYKTVKKPSQKIAVDILRTAQFYKSRHKLLEPLRLIDDRDKHEMPILAAACYDAQVVKLPPNVSLQGKTGRTFTATLTNPEDFVLLEHGAKLPFSIAAATEHGPIMHMECELTANIAFGQGEILEGQPVLKTLHDLTQLVEGVTDAFLAAGLLTRAHDKSPEPGASSILLP